MINKLVIGAIATVVLFIIGILMVSIFNMFSENWLIGIGLIAGGIGVISVIIYMKAKN